MTTGAPLFLVSACGSAAEFVAAFRRYVDRTGLFVPSATPLPAGRRGRVAVTLVDGGVMIEGEAEILQSSTRPSVLYGRPGMTLKFLDPDDHSMAVIGELEKARLAINPAATAVTPRPASVPAAPRPVPPPTGGRIDAANALAECVVIGDLSTLRETAKVQDSSASRFVVPSIPAPRPKVPTVPPLGKPSNATTHGMPALERTPAKPPAAGPPSALDPAPVDSTAARANAPAPVDPTAGRANATEAEITTVGQAPPKKPPPPPTVVAKLASHHESNRHKTSLGFPAMRHPVETQPFGLPAASPPPPESVVPATGAAGLRPKPPTVPPRERLATPVAPMPVTKWPAKSAPVVEDERTDLSEIPVAQIAVEEPEPAAVDDAPQAPIPHRSGGMRASEILAAIPSTGDWVMAPDEAMPRLVEPDQPAAADDRASQVSAAPAKRPTGDWTISHDAEAGWSEPAKVQKPAEAPSGNPVGSVASDQPITAVQLDDRPVEVNEAKIEIDPSFLPPQPTMSSVDVDVATGPPLPAGRPPALPGAMPQPLAPMHQIPRVYAPEPRGVPPRLRATGPRHRTMPATSWQNRKLLFAIAAGVGVVAAIIILFAMGTDTERSSPPNRPRSGSATKAGRSVATTVPGSAGVAIDAAVADPAPATCSVEVSTTPPGADVMAAATKLVVTPGSFELPCGAETKLTIRKKGHTSAERKITPAADQPNKLVVKLARMLFSVKVMSSPAGATITASGKSMGVTPTTIKLPAYEQTAITVTKPGYAPETRKITPKANNTAQQITLKKGRR